MKLEFNNSSMRGFNQLNEDSSDDDKNNYYSRVSKYTDYLNTRVQDGHDLQIGVSVSDE